MTYKKILAVRSEVDSKAQKLSEYKAENKTKKEGIKCQKNQKAFLKSF